MAWTNSLEDILQYARPAPPSATSNSSHPLYHSGQQTQPQFSVTPRDCQQPSHCNQHTQPVHNFTPFNNHQQSSMYNQNTQTLHNVARGNHQQPSQYNQWNSYNAFYPVCGLSRPGYAACSAPIYMKPSHTLRTSLDNTSVRSLPSIEDISSPCFDWTQLIPPIHFGYSDDSTCGYMMDASRSDHSNVHDGDISSNPHLNEAFIGESVTDSGCSSGYTAQRFTNANSETPKKPTPIAKSKKHKDISKLKKSNLDKKAVKPARTRIPKSATPKIDCSICNRQFKSQKQFERHQNTCSITTRVYTCDTCSKSFNQKCTLRIHLRTHTGEAPCACRYCSKSFIDNSTRRKHELTHTNERRFTCTLCPYRSNQNGNLKRHLEKMHPQGSHDILF